MQINKTYLIVGGLLLAMAGATAYLVMKAPRQPGSAAATSDPEGLSKPRALAFDKDGKLLIVDSKNNRIVVQKRDGSLVKRFGHLGTAKGDFREPCGIAVNSKGAVYVADTFYTLDPAGGLPWGRIQKFDDDYDFKALLSKPEDGPSDFFGPRAVAVDPSDRVWVSDTGNHRLLVYGPDGKFLKALGQKGSGNLEFIEPFGMGFDSNGNAYVADRLNFRIQVINKAFGFVRAFKVDAWEATQINQEPYVAVDNARSLVWISDPTKNKVLAYSFDGKKKDVYTQGLVGGSEGAFNLPTGLAVGPDGLIYVSDGGSGRILTIKP